MAVSQTQIQPPADWQTFERASAVLWSEILEGGAGVHRFGRGGQAQYGLDMHGYRQGDTSRMVGIQCKCIEREAELDPEIFRGDVRKALDSGFDLTEYYVTHTGRNDGKLDKLAIELTAEQKKLGRNIIIRVWGWGTLQEHITQHQKAMDAFDPTVTLASKSVDAKLDQLLALAHLGAAIGTKSTGALNTEDVTDSGLGPERHIDKEIDRYRRMLIEGNPSKALACLEDLWGELEESASGRIRFRVRANIGHCHLHMGDDDKAADELLAAVAFWPDDVKAISNRVLALILKGSNDLAFEIAREALTRFPEAETLGAYLLQSIKNRTEITSPLDLLPEPLRQAEDVLASYVDLLRYRKQIPHWWQAAREFSDKIPQNEQLRLHAADAVVDRISRTMSDARSIDASDWEELTAASQVLGNHYSKISKHEVRDRDDHVAYAINYAVSLLTLGDVEKAKSIAISALDISPDDEQLILLAGRLALEGNDSDLANLVFLRLNDFGEHLLLKCQIAARCGNWAFLRDLTEDNIATIPETDRSIVASLAKVSVAKSSTPEDAANIAASLLGNAGDDPRANILVANLARDLNLSPIEEKAFQNALGAIDDDSHFSSRAMVADYAFRKDAFGVVIRLLDGFLDNKKDTSELRMLAKAHAFAMPPRKSGASFFSSLPEALRSNDRYQHLEAILSFNVGDLESAEAQFRILHAKQPNDARAALSVIQTLARKSKDKAPINLFLRGMHPQDLTGNSADKARIAHALSGAGRKAEAVELAYSALSEGKDDPETNLLYVLLLYTIGDVPHLKTPQIVHVGCWVEIEGPEGEVSLFLIEEGPDRPSENIYGLSHQYASLCLGKKVGDEFSLPHVVSSQIWTIKGIKSRYLQALHDISENFNARFPGYPGFWKVTMKEDDISPILDVAKRRGEHVDRVLNIYENNNIPLHFLASMGGQDDVISLMETIRMSGGEIRTCIGLAQEREIALAAVSAARSKGVVLDTMTFSAAVELEAIPLLKAMFGRVLIARTTVDEIMRLKEDYVSDRGNPSPQGSISFYRGEFFLHETTAEDLEARGAFILERERSISEIEVATIHFDDSASPEIEGFVQHCGIGSVGPALVAADNKMLLLSDDFSYRSLFGRVCEIDAAWLQAVFMHAQYSGVIALAEYARLVAGLARLRHDFVAVDHAALIKLLPKSGTTKGTPFEATAGYLGTRSADINSHVEVSAEFLKRVWAGPLVDLPMLSATGALLENLLRFRSKDWQAIIKAIQTYVNDVNFDHYLARWRKGHFLV